MKKYSAEKENVAFKEIATPDLYKEVAAFANTHGGTVYVGVDDEGNRIGLENPDEQSLKVTNGIRDNIEPDITMFTDYHLADDGVFTVDVNEGTNKPYYLKNKGMKPSGVYVRQGNSSVPASPEQIRALIRDSEGDVFEKRRAIRQDLTFSVLKNEFSHAGMDLSPEKYPVLGITDPADGLYTNLGLILSDQNPYAIKVAAFKDEDMTEFLAAKNFEGPLFTQFKEVLDYLALNNPAQYQFPESFSLQREERTAYPAYAMREALLNAVVHRDYSFAAPTIIRITQSQMRFLSPGRLPDPLTIQDVLKGISFPRNKSLAAIFFRLHFVEGYGFGVNTIMKLYKDQSIKPAFDLSPNTFTLVLPNRNWLQETKPAVPVSAQERQVLHLIRNNPELASEDIQQMLQVKTSRTSTIIRNMVKANLIQVAGRGKNKRFFLTETGKAIVNEDV